MTERCEAGDIFLIAAAKSLVVTEMEERSSRSFWEML